MRNENAKRRKRKNREKAQTRKREMFAYRVNCAFCTANDVIHIPLGVPTDNDFSSQFSINGRGQKTGACETQRTRYIECIGTLA
jgi:hypothetical protein